MTKIKTSELTGPALDWAVAECVGLGKLHYTDVTGRISTLKTAVMVWSMELPGDGHGDKFCPSADWSQAGPIIEREKLCIGARHTNDEIHWDDDVLYWARTTTGGHLSYGSTPLIAAMRCYVASKLGDEVEIPEELTT